MYLNKKDMVSEETFINVLGHKETVRFYENDMYFYFEILTPGDKVFSTIIQIRNVSDRREDSAIRISIESTVQKTKQIRTEYSSFSLPASMIENFIKSITTIK